jgi:VanZ family protein
MVLTEVPLCLAWAGGMPPPVNEWIDPVIFTATGRGNWLNFGLRMPLPKLKFRRDTVLPFVLAGTITWCSGYPASVPEMRWLETDKIGHFAAYGALATAIVRLPALARWPLLGGWWAIVLASGYGLGDEFRQSLNFYRSYDLADWAADTLGAAVAVMLYLRWAGYRRLMETPLWKKRAKNKAGQTSGQELPRKTQETQK